MVDINPMVFYERVKDFCLMNFQELTYPKDTEIIKEGERSNKLIILKEGAFMLAKSLESVNPFDRETGNISTLEHLAPQGKSKILKKNNNQQKLIILSPNSIVGEDGYLYKRN
jgi:CRP-like cAMP-binding protein